MDQTPQRPQWDLSKLASISPKHAEFVLDVDFDALTIHFYGRHRPSLVDPITEHLALLVDGKTREVVGLELRDFQEVWVKQIPSLLAVSRFSIIIGLDEELEEALDDSMPKPIRDLVEWARDLRYRTAKHATLRTLSALPNC